MRLPQGSANLAGTLFLIGAAQFIVAMMLGESIAPGYSMHDNAISDLGVISSTAALFNSSIFILGLCVIAGAVFYHQVHKKKLVTVLLFLGGIGAAGAGIFNLSFGVHGLFALTAFLFTPLAAIAHARLVNKPLGAISVLLGIIALLFLVMMVLWDSGTEVVGAIGHGGTERMIAYPVLIFLMALGGYLIAKPSESRSK